MPPTETRLLFAANATQKPLSPFSKGLISLTLFSRSLPNRDQGESDHLMPETCKKRRSANQNGPLALKAKNDGPCHELACGALAVVRLCLSGAWSI